jgi:hypothetical protein
MDYFHYLRRPINSHPNPMRNAKVVETYKQEMLYDKYYEKENCQLYNRHLKFKVGFMEQTFSYLNGFPAERKNILVLIKGMA